MNADAGYKCSVTGRQATPYWDKDNYLCRAGQIAMQASINLFAYAEI
jgi:hypothetical protein